MWPSNSALLAASQMKGGVAMIRFFGRATAAADETGTGRVYVVVRRNGPDSTSSFEGDYAFGREWQEVLIPFVFARDLGAGDTAVILRFGFKRQTLEIGGLEVLDYGRTLAYGQLPRTRFNYAGREPGAAWRGQALERINRIRQGDIVVSVRDSAGRPVAGAEVRIEQRRSAFQWGTALEMARLMRDSPRQRALPQHGTRALQRRQHRERPEVACLAGRVEGRVQPGADPRGTSLDPGPRVVRPRTRAGMARPEQPA